MTAKSATEPHKQWEQQYTMNQQQQSRRLRTDSSPSYTPQIPPLNSETAFNEQFCLIVLGFIINSNQASRL